MFNVNNKFALDPDNPMTTGGYNRTLANTDLAGHRLQAIARPNNDTLYTIALIVDATFAEEMERMFEQDFAHAEPIDPAALSDKPFWWRFGVNLSRLAAPVL
jgi:hypothetical protein